MTNSPKDRELCSAQLLRRIATRGVPTSGTGVQVTVPWYPATQTRRAFARRFSAVARLTDGAQRLPAFRRPTCASASRSVGRVIVPVPARYHERPASAHVGAKMTLSEGRLRR